MIQLEAVVPAEPVEKSVVLDRWGRAWQRGGTGWRAAGEIVSLFGSAATSWSALLIQCGPVRLILDGAVDPGIDYDQLAAAAESQRETWRAARAQLAQALGLDPHMTWPELIADVRRVPPFTTTKEQR